MDAKRLSHKVQSLFLRGWLFVVLIPSLGLGQTVIDVDNVPQVGDVMSISICSDEPNLTAVNAASGANQIWNYSYLTESREELLQILEPNATPWFSRYPNADYCAAFADSLYRYFVNTSDSVSHVGDVHPSSSDTIYFDYFDPLLAYSLPNVFGTINEDTAIGFVDGFGLWFDMPSRIETDAYGTLILPNATYQNVSRFKIYQEFNPNLGQGSYNNQWVWMSSDYRYPLLSITDLHSSLQVQMIEVWYNKTPVGVVTGLRETEKNSTHVFPNPVSENGVGSTSSKASFSQVKLMDSAGRMVRTFQTDQKRYSLLGMAKGLYFMQFINTEGKPTSTEKIVVN